jgi:two-component system phosphate regulon response regulator OmpR
LVVDDDKEILKLLSKRLEIHNFRVTQAANLAEMHAAVSSLPIDLIVLDVTLPDGSGLDACYQLRQSKNETPIIMLSALKEEVDRIVGFKLGADHYIGKPFSTQELVSIIHSVFRRTAAIVEQDSPSKFSFDGFVVNLVERSVHTNSGVPVSLTGGEFDILKVFIEKPGKVLSRDQILDFSRGHATPAFDRSVDIMISRIRKKLRDAGGSPDIMKTVRGGGYHFTSKVSSVGL